MAFEKFFKKESVRSTEFQGDGRQRMARKLGRLARQNPEYYRSEEFLGTDELRNELLKIISSPKHGAILLDGGCSLNPYAEFSSRDFGDSKVIAFDSDSLISGKFKREGKIDEIIGKGIDFTYIRAYLDKMPFEDNYADEIVTSSVLFSGYVNDDQHIGIISEVDRILKPGGLWIVNDEFNGLDSISILSLDFLNALDDRHYRTVIVEQNLHTQEFSEMKLIFPSGFPSPAFIVAQKT
jgi:ubiquinone/menaquinone biosynthesis C-methylase UbiE